MTGVVHELDANIAVRAFDRLAKADMDVVLKAISEMIVGHTKERIENEKTAPDGTAWAPWSEAYDNTRTGNKQTLLVDGGDLYDSIAGFWGGSSVKVGTNLIYGAIHQFGGKPGKDGADAPSGAVGNGIPARPYLGLSSENSAEIEQLVADRIAGYLQ